MFNITLYNWEPALSIKVVDLLDFFLKKPYQLKKKPYLSFFVSEISFSEIMAVSLAKVGSYGTAVDFFVNS